MSSDGVGSREHAPVELAGLLDSALGRQREWLVELETRSSSRARVTVGR